MLRPYSSLLEAGAPPSVGCRVPASVASQPVLPHYIRWDAQFAFRLAKPYNKGREVFIEIVAVGAGGQVITVIEGLSPANKAAGQPGRDL